MKYLLCVKVGLLIQGQGVLDPQFMHAVFITPDQNCPSLKELEQLAFAVLVDDSQGSVGETRKCGARVPSLEQN